MVFNDGGGGGHWSSTKAVSTYGKLRNTKGVRLIQSRIEANEFENAARLCKRAWETLHLDDETVELALEAYSARDEAVFERDEEIKRISYLFDQYTKSSEFQQRASALLKSGTATNTALKELLANTTAVQDLQIVFSLGSSTLTAKEPQQLLRDAFQHVIDNKLVFDDQAAVYFNLGLEWFFTKEYITKKELEYWRMKTYQVNMESAPWVTEMQATIKKLQAQVKTLETNAQILKTHFESLRLALIQKKEEEQQRERRQKIVSLLSLGLVFAGGPVIRELMNGVMDLADLIHLLSATLELAGKDEVAKFCATVGAKVVFREGIAKLLERSNIELLEFASALKDAVILEHPEFAPSRNVAQLMKGFEEKVGLATKLQEDYGNPSTETRTARYESPTLQEFGRQQGHDVGERPRHESDEEHKKHPAPSVQDFEDQQLDEFPFHHAVQQSNGDVNDFLELLGYVDHEGYDVNQAHEVIVKAGDSPSEYKCLTLPPYMFASYLGYVDIVKHLIDHKDFRVSEGGGERVVVTVNRARKAASAAQVA